MTVELRCLDVPENDHGMTPGTWLRLDELLEWLEERDLVKTARALHDAATPPPVRDGRIISIEVKRQGRHVS